MAELTRYAYDSRTGVYTGTTVATTDPMNPGKFLEPWSSTPLPPPPPVAGMAPSWTKLGWRLQPDHRGETWWKGVEPVLIDGLGDPSAQGLTVEPVFPDPPPPSSCSKLGLIRAFRERGWWSAVKAMIASDEDMQDDWDAATELRITDPTLRKAIANLPSAALPILTEADVQALVTRANELVA